MSERYTITLPWPNGSKIGSNSRGAWSTKYREIRALKELACGLAMQALGKRARHKGRSRITYRFFVEGNKRMDADNMIGLAKHYVDGLKVAGLIYDDDWAFLQIAGVEVAIDRENPRVELVVENEH